jgi:hypothetical protein
VLLVAAGAVLFVATGAGVAMMFIRDDGPADVPPPHTVAGAYWAAVQRKDLAAMRRLLCDADRVLLSAVDSRTLTRTLFPMGRRILGFTITGEQDAPATVVFVQVVRADGERVYTVTRPTPVVEHGGMFTVCFHSAGLYPGT